MRHGKLPDRVADQNGSPDLLAAITSVNCTRSGTAWATGVPRAPCIQGRRLVLSPGRGLSPGQQVCDERDDLQPVIDFTDAHLSGRGKRQRQQQSQLRAAVG